MVAWHTDKFVTSGLVNIQENFREITLSLKNFFLRRTEG